MGNIIEFNYEEAKKLLTSQGKFYINLGLDRIKAVLNLLENPQDNLKIIHVAGTNGKGSVCAILANILTKSGYKTGLYTSPHLVEYTERIKIDNKEISKDDFARYIQKICNLADEHKIDLTEFEILTACAFKYFSDNKVDIVITETGLGGRFDATNICSNPLLEIITSISLDHTDKLGNTIETIAFEKAGIIKEKSVLITAKSNKGYNILEKVCMQKNAELKTVENDVDTVFEKDINYAVIGGEKYEFPLIGLYQKQNLALVVKAVEFLKKNGYTINLTNGLKTVKWQARLEYLKDKNILIDGAHNPDGATELKKSIDYYFNNQRKIFIYSTINTKDYISSAKILFKPDDEIYFYEFNHKNAVSFEEYINNVPWLKNIKKIDIIELDEVLKKHGLKVITGSLYMIGELYNRLV